MSYLVTKNVKTHKVAVYAVDQKADLERFNTDEAIPQEITGWEVTQPLDLGKTSLTNKELLDLYNANREQPLVKFPNKQAAMERTFDVFPNIAQPIADLFPAPKKGAKKADPDTQREIAAEAKSRKATPRPPKATSPKADTSDRKKVVINLEPQNKAYACREGTKQALLIDALAKGATLTELLNTCDKSSGGKVSWTENSVKSGIYWDVNKVKGYGIRTEFDKDGTPRYFLVYPKGSNAPVPHRPRASA